MIKALTHAGIGSCAFFMSFLCVMNTWVFILFMVISLIVIAHSLWRQNNGRRNP